MSDNIIDSWDLEERGWSCEKCPLNKESGKKYKHTIITCLSQYILHLEKRIGEEKYGETFKNQLGD